MMLSEAHLRVSACILPCAVAMPHCPTPPMLNFRYTDVEDKIEGVE